MTFEVRADHVENHPLGYVETRELQGSYSIELENSDGFNVDFTESYEALGDTFNIATGVPIPDGR